jgi:hypothetical protein
VQDWRTELFFACFCVEGDVTIIIKLLGCVMRSSHEEMVKLMKQACSQSSWTALSETLHLRSSKLESDVLLHGNLRKVTNVTLV